VFIPVKLAARGLGVLIDRRVGTSVLIPLRVADGVARVIPRRVVLVVHDGVSGRRCAIRRVHGAGRRGVAPGNGAGVPVAAGGHHRRHRGRRGGRGGARGRQIPAAAAHGLPATHDRVRMLKPVRVVRVVLVVARHQTGIVLSRRHQRVDAEAGRIQAGHRHVLDRLLMHLVRLVYLMTQSGLDHALTGRRDRRRRRLILLYRAVQAVFAGLDRRRRGRRRRHAMVIVYRFPFGLTQTGGGFQSAQLLRRGVRRRRQRDLTAARLGVLLTFLR